MILIIQHGTRRVAIRDYDKAELTKDEWCDIFVDALRGLGYCIPINETLEFVEEEH